MFTCSLSVSGHGPVSDLITFDPTVTPEGLDPPGCEGRRLAGV